MGAAAAAESADAEERERNAEIADLKRRVIFGAVLTAPVLFAVMFVEFFGVTWMPRGADEPLVPADADQPGDVLHGLADPPHRLARTVPPAPRT